MMKVFSKTNRSKLSSPASIMTWALVILMMFSSLTSVTAETSEKNKTTTMVFIIDNSTYVVNGEPIVMDVSPTIIENRTMLPIRYAAEPLGADIEWDGVERKATISLDEIKLELWIGESNALINGKTVPIDADNANVKPLIVSNRTMLPLRFVTENLGCDIEWDPVDRKATITKTGSSSGIGKIPGIIVEPGKISDISIIDPGKISDIIVDPDKISDISIIDPGIDIGKIILKPDLKSDDTTVLKSAWGKDPTGKSYPVLPSEADIPVVMRVGCGYDVFGKYASVDSLKEQVLNVSELIQDQRMMRLRYDSYESPYTEGRSIKEYSEKMSVSARAGGSFMGFSGSVKTNFEEAHTQKEDNYFATRSHLVKKYGVYISTPTGKNLQPYLTAAAAEYLNDKTISPATVFATFGHHVLVDSITGGRIDYSITASSKASTSFENFSIAAKAEYKTLFASASASGEYQKIKNKEEYFENRDTNFKKYGGDPIFDTQVSDPHALTAWENSLENKGTLVEFGNTTTQALLPIWELCSDADRAQELKQAFEQLSLAEGKNWPSPQYLTGIALLTGKTQYEAWSKNITGYKVIDGFDLNGFEVGQYAFLAYELGENPDDAITDFFMEHSYEKYYIAEPKKMTHNGNTLMWRRWFFLNTYYPDPIYNYLYYTTKDVLPPIKEIAVVYDTPDSAYPDWHTVCWQNTQQPANINQGSTVAKRVFIKYRR